MKNRITTVIDRTGGAAARRALSPLTAQKTQQRQTLLMSGSALCPAAPPASAGVSAACDADADDAFRCGAADGVAPSWPAELKGHDMRLEEF